MYEEREALLSSMLNFTRFISTYSRHGFLLRVNTNLSCDVVSDYFALGVRLSCGDGPLTVVVPR